MVMVHVVVRRVVWIRPYRRARLVPLPSSRSSSQRILRLKPRQLIQVHRLALGHDRRRAVRICVGLAIRAVKLVVQADTATWAIPHRAAVIALIERVLSGHDGRQALLLGF